MVIFLTVVMQVIIKIFQHNIFIDFSIVNVAKYNGFSKVYVGVHIIALILTFCLVNFCLLFSLHFLSKILFVNCGSPLSLTVCLLTLTSPPSSNEEQ